MVVRRIGAVAFSALLITGLAACSDDGGDDESVALEDSGDADNDESTDTTSDSSDGDAIAGAFSEGCGEFSQVFAALGASIGAAFDEEAADEFDQFVDDAPDEIRDDLVTLRDAYAEYAQALEDAGVDLSDPSSIDPSDIEAFQEIAAAGEIFNSEELQQASENIDEFISDNCGG